MREVRPRLWYWTAPHPDWTPDQGGPDGWEREVGSYAHVSPDGATLVLVDPLVTDWDALDGDVEHHGPPHVLITCFWHSRSTPSIVDRYEGARVWAYAPAREKTEERTRVTDVFELGDALPAGIEPVLTAPKIDEVSYRLPEYDAVVIGDALAAAPGAPLRVWAGDAAHLRTLLDRPLELLLLTHGEPVLEGGGEALARALDA